MGFYSSCFSLTADLTLLPIVQSVILQTLQTKRTNFVSIVTTNPGTCDSTESKKKKKMNFIIFKE